MLLVLCVSPVVIRSSKVWNLSVVVVPPVLDVLLAHVPVQLPRQYRAPGPRVPRVQGLGGHVVVLPAAEQVPRYWIQVVSGVLLVVIVVVSGPVPLTITQGLSGKMWSGSWRDLTQLYSGGLSYTTLFPARIAILVYSILFYSVLAP